MRQPAFGSERLSCAVAFLVLAFEPQRRQYISMSYSEIITVEPGKRSGKPCIRGMRITVSDVLEYLASGMTEDEIISDFPELTREDIHACLSFAADREKKLSVAVA
jgi:uncharacterized protein (DUF433 family)